MESKVKFASVGAFVIVLTLAMIGGALWLSSGKYYRKTYDTYETYMTESVSGLNLNAPVRYRGVDVGRVRTIMLAPDNVEQVRLVLDVERGTPVKEDTLATLQMQGLTGIALHRAVRRAQGFGGAARAPGRALPGDRVGAVADRAPRDRDARAAGEPRAHDREPERAAQRAQPPRVGATLANLDVLTRTLAERSSAIDAPLGNAARTLDNAARVTAELPQLVQRFERTADALDRMAGEVVGAATSTRDTLDGARSMLDSSRADLAQFTGMTLPEVRDDGRRVARTDGDDAPRRRGGRAQSWRADAGTATGKTRTRGVIDDA